MPEGFEHLFKIRARDAYNYAESLNFQNVPDKIIQAIIDGAEDADADDNGCNYALRFAKQLNFQNLPEPILQYVKEKFAYVCARDINMYPSAK